MASTPEESPTTSTGVGLGCGADGFPSWPALFMPQHRTAPPESNAQVCAPPAAMASTPEESPTTSTGAGLGSGADGFPSSSPLFVPQHTTEPRSRSAHE